ncbi:hypothetical protein EDD22DRAFT_848159 [Suillus occidentalis]|nr:hypothetical protein EDD22DRAFT_848159 [Suillus occidentalis]
MSHVPPEWNHITELPVIPIDWTLNITNVAMDRLLVEPPTTLLSCGQLALCMADAYRHSSSVDQIPSFQEDSPGLPIGYYRLQVLDHPVVSPRHNESLGAVICILPLEDLLKRSIKETRGSWRILGSNFQPSESPNITPGRINIVLCWFQQGHECYGPSPKNPNDRFTSEISSILKGKQSLSMIMAMQRPVLLASAVFSTGHPLELRLCSVGLWYNQVDFTLYGTS